MNDDTIRRQVALMRELGLRRLRTPDLELELLDGPWVAPGSFDPGPMVTNPSPISEDPGPSQGPTHVQGRGGRLRAQLEDLRRRRSGGAA